MAGNTSPDPCLTFRDVDGVAYALTRNALRHGGRRFRIRELGPYFETLLLSAYEPLLEFAAYVQYSDPYEIREAVASNAELWLSGDRSIGILRTQCSGSSPRVVLTDFLMKAKGAAKAKTGLSEKVAGQLAAAIGELESNVHEHSENVSSGLVAYRADESYFEFLVADQGIGILESLRKCSSYSSITDSGYALATALTDGSSRYGPQMGRGYGFRPIFVGLANLRGYLRFRSGDYALTVDGVSPGLIDAQITQKVSIRGFLASIKCYS